MIFCCVLGRDREFQETVSAWHMQHDNCDQHKCVRIHIWNSPAFCLDLLFEVVRKYCSVQWWKWLSAQTQQLDDTAFCFKTRSFSTEQLINDVIVPTYLESLLRVWLVGVNYIYTHSFEILLHWIICSTAEGEVGVSHFTLAVFNQ